MSSESLVRKRISPIHRKSGSAVSVHDDIEPQIVTAMASPTGRLVKSSMPIQADAEQREADPQPAPSSAKRKTMRTAVMRRSIARYSMSFEFGLGRAVARVRGRGVQHEVVDHGDGEHDGARAPWRSAESTAAWRRCPARCR